MNVLILGDQGMALNEWLISNVAMISFLALYLNSKRSWARRILHFWIALAALGVLIVSTYVVIDHRLYELPAFNQIMMAGSLAFLPLTVLMIVTGSTIRTRVFREPLMANLLISEPSDNLVIGDFVLFGADGRFDERLDYHGHSHDDRLLPGAASSCCCSAG